MISGICYLVGAGPGDPGLLTLRGAECLRRADVVVYDYLADPALLAHAPASAERIYAGKKAGDHALTQDQTNALLVEKTAAGKVVVRLKGGDPYLFGRGGEEALALEARGLRFEVVPGVTSAIAAPASAGIPVTHRGMATQVTFFTGHEMPGKASETVDYPGIANSPGTAVMLMGAERLEEICTRMIAAGAPPDRPAALVQWGSTPRQRSVTGTMATLPGLVAEAGLGAPAIVVFGPTVVLHEKLAWRRKLPLFGRRIMVTRTRELSGTLSSQLAEAGAATVEFPTIKHEPPSDPVVFRQLVQDAHVYDWLVFTSPRGVEAFFEQFYTIYKDAREIGACRIATIGNGTAAKVREYRLQVDIIPEKAVAEALLAALEKECDVDNQRILVVRPETARDVLAQGLMEAGAIVDEAVAYRTVPDLEARNILDQIEQAPVDFVTFTSASTVDAFFALATKLPQGAGAASIGPITSECLRSHGIEPVLEAEHHDIPGLVSAIVTYCGTGKSE